MKKNLYAVISTLFLFLFLSASLVFAEENARPASISLGGWFTTLGGTARAGDEVLGFKNDLGIDNDTPLVFAAKYNWGKEFENGFELSYWSAKNTGSVEISRSFTFNSRTFTLTNLVSSNLETRVWEGLYNRKFINTKNGDLSGLVGIKFVSLKFDATNATLSQSTSISVSNPIPEIGIGGNIKAGDKGSLYGKILVSSISSGRKKANLIDYSLGFKYDINPVFFDLGYRYLRLGAQTAADREGSLMYKGPFFSAGYTF